jgi:predicted amidohydrolase
MNFIGVQLDIVWEDKAATFERVRRLLEEQGPAAGALLVLPVMFSTGFSMNVA